MNDDKQHSDTPVSHPTDKKHGGRRMSKRLIMLIAAGVVAVGLMGGGGYVTYVSIQKKSGPDALLASLQNTLSLEQIKFTVDSNRPKSASGATESLKMDGAYKKDAGLTWSAGSTVTSSGFKITRNSTWVTDPSSTAYANLSLYSTRAEANSPIANTPTAQQMEATAQSATEKAKGVWSQYANKDLSLAYPAYGVPACVLTTFYKTQSKPANFQDLMTKIAGDLTIEKTASESNNDTYKITVNSNKYDEVSKAYLGSDAYKALIGCDALTYTATTQSLASLFKNLTVTVTIDTSKKLLTSIRVSVKDSTNFNVTIASAGDVTFSIPSNPQKYQPVGKATLTPRS